MNCECMIQSNDYSIEIVQGDFFSCLYDITNQDGSQIMGIDKVLFSSKYLNIVKELQSIDSMTYQLELTSEETAAMKVGNNATYDITITFNTDETPVTVVYEAQLSVLKKENTIG